MAKASIKSLRERASLALRSGDFEVAVESLHELERREPESPIWPQRRAEAHGELGQREAQVEALQRAAELTIDAGQVIQAIAICKQILEIDPDHVEIQDRMHLLYSEPAYPQSTPCESTRTEPMDPELSRSAPLEEVLLTEVLPGSLPAGLEDASDLGVAEIQLDAAVEGGCAREQLMQTPLFGSLGADALRDLITQVQLVELRENQVLFRQGDTADTLYVIAEGAVVPIAEEEPPKKLAVLEAGSFFGEIGLVTNRPRNATIQAIVDTRLLAIDRRAMWALIRNNPEVLKVMVRFLRDRSIDRLVRTNPFFQAFAPDRRAAVAKLFRFLEARDGKALIEQGSPASNLYALVTGRVEIMQSGTQGEKSLATLAPGTLFGEISLLRGEPAVASVVARGKCWLMALSRDRLLSLIKHNPGVEATIEEIARARESYNEREGASSLTDGGDPLGPI